MEVTPRVRARIEQDFAEDGSAHEVIRLVAEASDSERVQAAIVLAASGRLSDLRDAAALAQVDWRDLLVSGRSRQSRLADEARLGAWTGDRLTAQSCRDALVVLRRWSGLHLERRAGIRGYFTVATALMI